MSLLNRSGLLFLISFLMLSGFAMMNAPAVFAAELDDTDQAIGQLKKDFSTGVYDSDHDVGRLRKEFSDVFNSRNDAQGIPQKIDKNIDTHPTAQGDMGEIERFVRLVMSKSVKLRNDYLEDLTAVGWDSLLNAKRLEKDSGMTESKLIIEKARAVVELYKAKTDQMLADNLKAIDTINISASSKQAFRSGYVKASVARKGRIEELWQLESQIISEVESIIYHLEARRAHWSVQDGQLLFEKQNDLDIYRSYLKSITDLSKWQEDIQKQSFDSALKKLDVIK
jgi:hypothetical protein